FDFGNGDVAIAAITSCTNTSNPSVLIAAGLVARKARAKGLTTKPWVKTSLAPGSQVVSDYLNESGLQQDLDALGFDLVGYGCTTCIGNSGPLPEPISKAIDEGSLVAAAVLSRNRNFDGRVHAERCGRDQRDRQLRGARPRRGARELPRVAAPRRRVCARRDDGLRPVPRAA